MFFPYSLTTLLIYKQTSTTYDVASKTFFSHNWLSPKHVKWQKTKKQKAEKDFK